MIKFKCLQVSFWIVFVFVRALERLLWVSFLIPYHRDFHIILLIRWLGLYVWQRKRQIYSFCLRYLSSTCSFLLNFFSIHFFIFILVWIYLKHKSHRYLNFHTCNRLQICQHLNCVYGFLHGVIFFHVVRILLLYFYHQLFLI